MLQGINQPQHIKKLGSKFPTNAFCRVCFCLFTSSLKQVVAATLGDRTVSKMIQHDNSYAPAQ